MSTAEFINLCKQKIAFYYLKIGKCVSPEDVFLISYRSFPNGHMAWISTTSNGREIYEAIYDSDTRKLIVRHVL